MQPRGPVLPSTSTITKPTATVSATHDAPAAESELDVTSESSDEETGASASMPHGSVVPTPLQDIDMEAAASDERMVNPPPSSQGSLIEPSQMPKERLAMKYAMKKKRKLAGPRHDAKEKSEDKEPAPVPNVEHSRAGSVDVFIAPEEEELKEKEDNPLASCLLDTFTIRKSSQVPVTSTASHTAETSIPESQSVRSEPASTLSEKRATQHVAKQSCGRRHTTAESTPAGKPRKSKSRSHAGPLTTESRRSSPPRKSQEESKISPRKRRQRSPTPESRRHRGRERRDEQITKERRRLMERLRELDREQDEPRSRTPDRRGIPRP